MHLMDTAALVIALPSIARSFGVEAVSLRFIITVHMLTIAVMVPASTWLSARFGTRKTFICAMLLFATGSLMCAVSGNQTHLLVARIVQGCGGAMMTPLGRSIVVLVSRREHLVKAMTSFTLPGVLAPMIGPPLAGLLVEYASWRWIFVINVLICLIGVICTLIFVPKLEKEELHSFDVWGFFILGLTMVTLIAFSEYFFMEGAKISVGLCLVATSIVAAALYLRHFRRSEKPVLDLSLLKIDTLRTSLWSGFLHRIAVGAMPLLLSLQLQEAFGKSAFETGNIMLGVAVGAIIGRLVIGRVLGSRSLKTSMIFWGGVSAILAAVPATFGFMRYDFFMLAILIGVGFARSIYFIPVTTLAYSGLPRDNIGQTTVLFTMAQQFSLGLGISFAGGIIAMSGKTGPDSFILPYLAIGLFAGLSILPLLKLSHKSGRDLVQSKQKN